MKVTWLTQAGLMFENERMTVIVDPYLSDSQATNGKKRRVPVDESYLDVCPDVILLTHSHPYHLDTETLSKYLSRTDKSITVLASKSAYEKLIPLGYRHNIVLLSPHSVWSESGVTF